MFFLNLYLNYKIHSIKSINMIKLFYVLLFCLSNSFAFGQFQSCKSLMTAVQTGEISKVEKLLKYIDSNCHCDGDGSPLIIAAKGDELEIAQLLIANGASIEMSVKGDGNPLIMAAKYGRLSMVKYLVESGADVNAYVVGDETPLIAAAWNGHLEVVKYLVEQGADINKIVRDGYYLNSETRNALKMAKRGGHQAVIDYLLCQVPH